MGALKQNASGLYINIQKIGCYFRAALRMAEYISQEQNGRFLSVKEINKIWDFCHKLRYIDSDDNVKDSAAIANMGLEFLGLRGRFVEVATFRDGVLTWYGVPRDKRRIDFYIQKIKQNGPSKTHFINVDKYGSLIWDPHDPEIIKTGVFYTVCYKYEGETN